MAVLLARQMSQMRAPLYRDTDVFRWCVGLADALVMLHARTPQVIHRDIKVGKGGEGRGGEGRERRLDGLPNAPA